MADLQGNPWSFTSADAAVIKAITSITRNGFASATVQATAHGFVKNQFVSLQGNNPSGWNGPYRIEEVQDANNFLIRIEQYRSTLANAGAGGNAATIAYIGIIDVTQMLWDSPTVSQVLSLTDTAGRTVWNPTAVTGGTLTYAKVFPISGLVINALPSGILQISV